MTVPILGTYMYYETSGSVIIRTSIASNDDSALEENFHLETRSCKDWYCVVLSVSEPEAMSKRPSQ